MPWKCPQDANDVLDTVNICPLCGYVRFPPGIGLTADATGKELQVRLPATFGAAALKILGDPEVKFVSAEQFRIEKRPDQGGWAIVNIAWATNPVYVNGATIDGAGLLLKDGDHVSIKGKFFKLTVRMLT